MHQYISKWIETMGLLMILFSISQSLLCWHEICDQVDQPYNVKLLRYIHGFNLFPEYIKRLKLYKFRLAKSSHWQKARIRADLPQVRVHDLKHTFGRRLRAAGVSFEDRQDLLGHKSTRITTTYYSAAELSSLIEAANKVSDGRSGPVLTLLRRTG